MRQRVRLLNVGMPEDRNFKRGASLFFLPNPRRPPGRGSHPAHTDHVTRRQRRPSLSKGSLPIHGWNFMARNMDGAADAAARIQRKKSRPQTEKCIKLIQK